MKYKFYTTSEETWEAMREAVESAKEYAFLESYILEEDMLTKGFFNALKARARAGVKVKIVVDQLGSYWFGALPFSEFEEAGIEILFFRRIFNRNHRKVLIIDGRVAFVGGVNVSGKYAKWLDLHVQMRDPFFIKKLLRSFARVYQLAGGGDGRVTAYVAQWPAKKPRRTLYGAKIFLAEYWPFRRRSALKEYYRKKIGEATQRIVMVTPYFAPRPWLVRALTRAIARGVRVEVLLPRKTDVALLDTANWIFMEELSEKIQFSVLPEMIHAKVLLVDGQEGMIGSNNIDAQSFDLNLETGVIFQRKDMIRDLKKILQQWRESAIPYNELPKWQPWYYRIVKLGIKLINPVL